MKETKQQIYETRCLVEILSTIEKLYPTSKSSILSTEEEYRIDSILTESSLVSIRLMDFSGDKVTVEMVSTVNETGELEYRIYTETIDTFFIHTKVKEILARIGL